jgi:multidrug transporter EmrE-like cation transporter
MAWVYLVVAGIFEWGWPVGLKLGWTEQGAQYGWIAFGCGSFETTLLDETSTGCMK